MVPAIKVYKVDYSFIIKNYLNQKLWKKTWTLFAYKDYVITIRLREIDTMDNRITFKLDLWDYSRNEDNHAFDFIYYSVDRGRIDMLIRNINGSIFRMINEYETQSVFKSTSAYQDVIEQAEIEEEKLKQVAEDFLDVEGITNSDIREAYIKSYVDNNNKSDELIDKMRYAFEYHLIPDLYLVFLESINNVEKRQEILNKLEENEIENITKEIEEYKTYIESEEFDDDMEDLLEEI